MCTVRESDIVDNAVVITGRMIDEFRRADGWIGIVRYERFERPPHRETNTPNSTYKKKGQHSLVESVALKAPAELLYESKIRYHHLIEMYSTENRYSWQNKRRGCGCPIAIGVIESFSTLGCSSL